MRSHAQSVVTELNRRRITGCISYVINSDLSVFIVCNKTGGTIKGDIKKFNNVIILIVDVQWVMYWIRH